MEAMVLEKSPIQFCKDHGHRGNADIFREANQVVHWLSKKASDSCLP
uniref:Uncharacterized protein n=1 Tax=Nelumbo nucifera TaxID=4432 RepID=A0A822YYR8_NELNU|nr:TPA_asm: hypothetical protein HUJ06_008291 [Nelumbo nucifera]